MDSMFHYIYTDEEGELVAADTDFQALGRSGNDIVEPLPEEMIPMPPGATFVLIPDRQPIVSKFNSFVPYPFPENRMVGVILPQGYTRTLLPAFILPLPTETEEGEITPPPQVDPLPLYGYTMAAWNPADERFYVAAIKTDEDRKWNPTHYNTADLPGRINKMKNRFPKNRLIKHLANCATNYSCFTAQNVFYQRWEGGLPVSPACNANCLGCISLQPSECCPAPQERITFIPTAEEGAQVMIDHLEKGEEAIMSFGQGCEGEPSLQAGLIADIIRRTRAVTAKGTINANTNAGNTAGIREMVDAGIDSLRVSLNSARPESYQRYYQPSNYTLEDVAASLRYAADKGCYTYLNLLFFPGFNDREEEVAALIDFVEKTGVKEIQFRNLNIDPDRYMATVSPLDEAAIVALGIPQCIRIIREALPDLKIGNYSKPLR